MQYFFINTKPVKNVEIKKNAMFHLLSYITAIKLVFQKAKCWHIFSVSELIIIEKQVEKCILVCEN